MKRTCYGRNNGELAKQKGSGSVSVLYTSTQQRTHLRTVRLELHVDDKLRRREERVHGVGFAEKVKLLSVRSANVRIAAGRRSNVERDRRRR